MWSPLSWAVHSNQTSSKMSALPKKSQSRSGWPSVVAPIVSKACGPAPVMVWGVEQVSEPWAAARPVSSRETGKV